MVGIHGVRNRYRYEELGTLVSVSCIKRSALAAVRVVGEKTLRPS